jgi:hypothetical protein
MNTGSSIAKLALAAVIGLSAVALSGAAAEARVRHSHHQEQANVANDDGWRDTRSRGWDNTCFNLPYLSAQFACDAR